MKYPILCATLITCLFHSLSAVAAPLDDKVAALKKAIKDEVAAKSGAPNSPQSPAYANAGYLVANLDQLVTQVDNPNMGNNAEMQISQILAAYTSEAAQKAGHELVEEIRQERKARIDAATDEIQALLKRVSDSVANAKKPEDLDSILVDLQKFQGNRYGGYNQENQALYQQVASAFEFTKLWQNYLSHMATGQIQQASNDLQNLSQNNYAVGIIPRSQILALQSGASTAEKGGAGITTPASQAESILKDIKTLDDMEPALLQLAPLRMNDGQVQMAYNNLASLVQTYNAVKAGLPTSLNLNFGGYNGGNGPGVSPALQSQLLVFIFQHYFDSYKGTPPTPEEKPQIFVNRVIADAISREDWPLLQKALAGQNYLNRNSVFGQYANVTAPTGIDNLLIALNQEAAGQYAQAVVSYQNALKVSDTNIPAKLIGDKLAAIQKDHPKEYDDGMQLVASPPVARYYPAFYQGIVPGMPYRPGTPGYPTTQLAPALSIPGAITNQVASPAPPPTAVPEHADVSTHQAPVKLAPAPTPAE